MSGHTLGFVLDSTGGEVLRFAGAELRVLASAESTAGAFTIVEEVDPLDTPRHVHEREDELFYVLEGEHWFELGDAMYRVGPGGTIFAPRRVPHAHRRVVLRTGRFLTMASPAGLDGFFRMLHEAEAGGTLGPEAYARASRRYGITWLD